MKSGFEKGGLVKSSIEPVHTGERVLPFDWSELNQRIALGLQPLADILSELVDTLVQTITELAIGLFEENWERYPDETLIEWGNRLEAMGKLDNPDIRWEYQKAMLLWLVSPIRWIWRKASE